MPANYDSLLGKLIVWGKDREETLHRANRALEEFVIDGVTTIIPFHQKVIKHPSFIKGDFTTHFVDKHIDSLI